MKKQYFTRQGENIIVTYPGNQKWKGIREIPEIVLRAIAGDYAWTLPDMKLAQEELRRRCNEEKEGE